MSRANIVFCIITSLLASVALAQDVPKSPIAKTSLVLNAQSLTPGQPAMAGVHFTLPEGWDIYWQNPGDSGIPTTLEWTLPEGVSAGAIQWPTPERIEVSGLVNYGYHHEVTLAVPLTAEKAGITGPITVKATYLICKDVCIPETATLSGTLPGVQGAQEIAQAAKQLPMDITALDGWKASYTATPNDIALKVTALANLEPPTSAEFFPIDDGVTLNSAVAKVQFSPEATDSVVLTLQRGTSQLVPVLHGVIRLHHAEGSDSFIQIAATLDESATASGASAEVAPAVPAAAPAPAQNSLLTLLAFAFIGGLILNIMPCVLPILALKALAITKKAQASRTAAAKQGGAYTAGVVLSFLAIAGVMLTLKASGAAIGWGFQLQNTSFVVLLGLVMLAVAANLLGLFEMPVLFGEKATGIDDSSLRGSFLTGALAVMVATPCSAPFMATAVGATLTLPTAQALLIFASLGLGMASPFLLISVWPAARRILPKPGAWMHRFKQILSIPMLATAAWLFWVAASMQGMPMTNAMPTEVTREAYSAASLQQLRDAGTPVLLDATAAWCLTCKVNERVALRPDSMQQFFRDHHITLMVADWTNNDPEITALLASFGRNGVPLYVYYPPHGEPVVLPQLLTPGIVRDAITNVTKN